MTGGLPQHEIIPIRCNMSSLAWKSAPIRALTRRGCLSYQARSLSVNPHSANREY